MTTSKLNIPREISVFSDSFQWFWPSSDLAALETVFYFLEKVVKSSFGWDHFRGHLNNSERVFRIREQNILFLYHRKRKGNQMVIYLTADILLPGERGKRAEPIQYLNLNMEITTKHLTQNMKRGAAQYVTKWIQRPKM